MYNINKKDLGGEDIAVQIEMMLDDTVFQSGWRPPVSMTDAINGEGIDDLIQNIMDHKEHVELSGLINIKKKNRFKYKIRELIYSKIDRIISEKFLNESDIDEIINHAVDEGKFKIYQVPMVEIAKKEVGRGLVANIGTGHYYRCIWDCLTVGN